MTNMNEDTELRDKLMAGLEKAYQKLLEFKKQNKTDLIVKKDGKIVKIKPE